MCADRAPCVEALVHCASLFATSATSVTFAFYLFMSYAYATARHLRAHSLESERYQTVRALLSRTADIRKSKHALGRAKLNGCAEADCVTVTPSLAFT